MTDSTPSATPQAPKRRFGGTVAQIRSALEFYKVLAYGTGSMLLLLTLELVVRYGFGSVLMAGGADAVTGASNALSFTHEGADGSFGVVGGFNVSIAVLIVHGWMYVVYLVADFRLWSLMRWPFKRFILIALGGVIPFLSFIVEGRIHREVQKELAAFPKASKRY